MKSVISIVFVLTVFVSLVFADEATDEFIDPENPGKCLIDKNTILFPGEEADHPKECARIICEEDGMATIKRCDGEVKKVKKECSEGGTISVDLPFPACCDIDLKCDDDDSDSDEEE